MNSLEINKILQRCPLTRNQYLGCFAADVIPKSFLLNNNSVKEELCAVINQDTNAEPGSHWIALYRPVNAAHEGIDYYDSLGDWPPPSAHLDAFLRQFPRVNRIEGLPLQSDRSGACGRHVIYFLMHRCRGWSLERIVHHLRRCRSSPDRVVNAFVRKHIFDEPSEA